MSSPERQQADVARMYATELEGLEVEIFNIKIQTFGLLGHGVQSLYPKAWGGKSRDVHDAKMRNVNADLGVAIQAVGDQVSVLRSFAARLDDVAFAKERQAAANASPTNPFNPFDPFGRP